MKKILKIVFAIVLILIIIFIIYMIRNYIIISKLYKMQGELAQKTNYSYVLEWYSAEDESNNKIILKYYYKDGKSIEKMGDTIIKWIDEETEEQIIINPIYLSADVYNEVNSEPVSLPIMFAEGSIMDKLSASLQYYISYDEINNQKCYVLKPLTGITSVLYYISVEDGTLVRVSTGHVEGQEDIKIIDYIEYSFDQLDDEDFSKPDLTGYEVTYHVD